MFAILFLGWREEASGKVDPSLSRKLVHVLCVLHEISGRFLPTLSKRLAGPGVLDLLMGRV